MSTINYNINPFDLIKLKAGLEMKTKYSDNQKTMEWKDDIMTINVIDVVKKLIVLLDSYKFINLLNWVCLLCTIAVQFAQQPFQSYNLILKVALRLQSFLGITPIKSKFKIPKVLCATFFLFSLLFFSPSFKRSLHIEYILLVFFCFVLLLMNNIFCNK